MSNNSTNAGKLLREIRQKRGLSLRKVAELANVSPCYLSFIERGKEMPGIECAQRIIAAVGIDMNDRMVIVGLWGKSTFDLSDQWQYLRLHGPQREQG